MKKVDLKPRSGRRPETIALDETVIKVCGEQYWFFAAVDPETNNFPNVGLYPYRTTFATKLFLQELPERHSIEDAELFVDGAPWPHAGLHELGMHFRHEAHGDRNPVERTFQEG